MSFRTPTGDATRPPRPDRRVDEACDRFEAAWKAVPPQGAGPRIEDYLAGVPAPLRPALLSELVLLEVDYRGLAGEYPQPEVYLDRFPELDPAWLGRALASRPTEVKPRVFMAAAEAATWPPQAPACGDAGQPEAGALPPPVGGYCLLRRLGGGGMGTVYEAQEVATGRRVALKFLAPELADSPEAIARFRAEGRLASTLAHPRCVFVFAADQDAGRPYIVMELMPGDTLADLVKRDGPLATEQALAYILDVIDGLQEAHQAGVIHRDVKPSNCFLTAEGRVKIGDFGLAKSLAPSAHLTKTGTFLGTPQFASPEQIKGLALDPSTDVYSVAATLYYLLAGQAPFEGSDALAVMARTVSEPPPPLRRQRSDVPQGLERVLLRALERDRGHRPTLEEFRAALVPFGPQQAVAGGPGRRFVANWLDGFLFVLLPLWGVGSSPEGKQALLLVWNGLWILYFMLLEGLWGWSLGKLLLGLRVTTLAGSDPPGLARALVRSVAHFVTVYLAATVLECLTLGHPDEWWWFVASVPATLVGAALLLVTMRRRSGYRGPHEILSGTRTVLLPRPESAGLAAESPLAREVTCGARPPEVPERLGTFAVQGTVRWTAWQKILTGTDSTLGRSVWIELCPVTDPALSAARRDLHRPGRLRWLSGGLHGQWQWNAFLAPAGAPAAALVADRVPLWWHQARPLLEQLTEELAGACADGTLPATLTPDQVWIRPGGLVALLDWPLADIHGSPPASQPGPEQQRALALLRQTAVLLLDRPGPVPQTRPGLVKRLALWGLTLGFAAAAAACFLAHAALGGLVLLLPVILTAIWQAKLVRAKLTFARQGFIHSPLPGHADALLARLLGGSRPYVTIEEMRAALDDTRDRPARVTPRWRLAHLATLGTLLAPGLVLMFLMGRSFNGMAITVLQEEIAASEKALYILDSGNLREFIHAHADEVLRRVDHAGVRQEACDDMVRRYSDPEVRRQLAHVVQRQKHDLEQRLQAINVVERIWLWDDLNKAEQLLQPGRAIDLKGFELGDFLEAAQDAEQKTRDPERFHDYAALHRGSMPLAWFVLSSMLLWPACWVVWAFLWRGGFTQRALGLSLVLANGHPALRLQCAWRAFVIWAPVAVLLGFSIGLEAYDPELLRLSWLCWGAALAVVLVFVALALRSPARGLHDFLAGTYVVPR